MILSAPLESLFPDAKARVLTVLVGTGVPLTGRTVSKLVGSSSSLRSVQLALAHLVEQGLVLKTEAGRSHQYLLNREHVAAAAITELVELRSGVLARVHARAEEWAARPVAVWIFGSVARRAEGSRSDLDVVVVTQDREQEMSTMMDEQLSALGIDASRWTGLDCRILELSEQDLRDMVERGDALIDELRRDAEHVYGEEPRTYLRSLEAK